jgi:serine phosphatase RsbU (regulator of sigma subunit)
MPSKTDPDLSRQPTVLGTKDKYTVNELTLMMPGDILVLYTDGLKEHGNDRGDYFPDRLEAKIRECKKEHARRILEEICRDVLSFAAPADDISCIVIKKT